MGFDFEDILGDTSYEDAVYQASEYFENLEEEMPEEELSEEEEHLSEYVTGTWQGKSVRFKRTWATHIFTDEEAEKLLNGEKITIGAANKKGKPFSVSGSLAELEYKGHKYIGFSPDYRK